MTEKKFAPETNELAEEALEQVAGGAQAQAVTTTMNIPGITPAILYKSDAFGTVITEENKQARGI